jgi:hypothetical protein
MTLASSAESGHVASRTLPSHAHVRPEGLAGQWNIVPFPPRGTSVDVSIPRELCKAQSGRDRTVLLSLRGRVEQAWSEFSHGFEDWQPILAGTSPPCIFIAYWEARSAKTGSLYKLVPALVRDVLTFPRRRAWEQADEKRKVVLRAFLTRPPNEWHDLARYWMSHSLDFSSGQLAPLSDGPITAQSEILLRNIDRAMEPVIRQVNWWLAGLVGRVLSIEQPAEEIANIRQVVRRAGCDLFFGDEPVQIRCRRSGRATSWSIEVRTIGGKRVKALYSAKAFPPLSARPTLL